MGVISMDIFKADRPTIAFLPLDLDYKLPNEEEVIKYCYANHLPLDVSDENGPCWLITPVCGRFDPAEWFNKEKSNANWFERYVEKGLPVQYVNNIDKKFPEIKYMLEQLPYRELSIATLFLQYKEVTCHIDWFKYDKYEDAAEMSIENEPRRFNVQLTNHHYKSSFVASSENGEKHYATITKEYPGYCISECYNWHGADLAGPDKITLFTTGLIDRVKRDELVERSLDKFGRRAIAFCNGELIDPHMTSKKNSFGR
jgi:hypothetical protein